GDLLDSGGDGVVVDLVVLVVGEVLVDGGFLSGQLFLDGCQVSFPAGPGLLVLGPGCRDGLTCFVKVVGVDVFASVGTPGAGLPNAYLQDPHPGGWSGVVPVIGASGPTPVNVRSHRTTGTSRRSPSARSRS